MDDLRVPAIHNFDGFFSPYVPSSPFPRYQTEAGPSSSYRNNERNRPMGRNKTPDLTSSFSKDLLPSKQASELSPASTPSDSNARHSYLSLEEVMIKLRPLLDGRPLADQQKICLKGVSLDVINEIREKSEAGWENLRYPCIPPVFHSRQREKKALNISTTSSLSNAQHLGMKSYPLSSSVWTSVTPKVARFLTATLAKFPWEGLRTSIWQMGLLRALMGACTSRPRVMTTTISR